ncbi:MAG: hypothetical protein GC181_15050 [Bacteroidetes bacterium]|nr:hypothetical protein [Bacteroidota bacterium]
MKKFIGYILRFIKEELNPKYLLFLICYLSLGIYLAYHNDWYRIQREEFYDSWKSLWFHCGLFSISFGGAWLGYMFYYKRWDLLKNWKFLLLFFISIFIFSFRMGSGIWLGDFCFNLVKSTKYPYYWLRIVSDLARYSLIMIPVTIIWWIERSSPTPYGFTVKNMNLKPYFGMVLIMIPVVILFGLTDHFGATYPRAGKGGLTYFDINVAADRIYFIFFEFIYGVDFISIEYFFRGFLVIAFARFVGAGAVLPMASFYVFIHFGKPYVETISSFFGGSLLGILSFYSRSIWGGIIVHVGIAWLMELGAFIGKIKS